MTETLTLKLESDQKGTKKSSVMLGPLPGLSLEKTVRGFFDTSPRDQKR